MKKRICTIFFFGVFLTFCSGQSAYLRKCKILYELQQFNQLMEPAMNAYNEDPNNDMANFYLSVSYGVEGDTSKVFQYINEAIRLTKDNLAFLIDVRAADYMVVGNYQLALKDFLWCYEHPINLKALYAPIGQCYEYLGDSENADKFYRMNYKSHPGNKTFMYDYAHFKSGIDQLDSAEMLYREILILDPVNVETMLGIAKLEINRGNLSKFMAKTDSLLQKLPSFFPSDELTVKGWEKDIYFIRAVSALYLEDFKQSIQNIDKTDPMDPMNILVKSMALMNLGKIKDVVKTVDNLSNDFLLADQRMITLKFLMLIYEKDHQKFADFLTAYLKTYPENPIHLANLLMAALPDKHTVLYEDFTYSKHLEKGELRFQILAFPKRTFFDQVMTDLSHKNQSDPSVIKAMEMITESYQFLRD